VSRVPSDPGDPHPERWGRHWRRQALRNPRIVLAALLGTAWMVLPLALSVVLLTRLGQVTDELHGQGDRAPWIAAALFAVTTGLGLLPTYAQAVLMGWVFGTLVGIEVSVAGYLGGTVIGYLVSALAVGDAARRAIDAQPRWRVVRTALVEASAPRTAGIVALLRFSPNSPFAITNLLLAASGVRFLPMLLGSIAGMLPRTAFAVWIGAEGAATGAHDLKELMDKQGPLAIVVGVVLLLAVLAILQQVGKRALQAAGLS
jgi:uncharacterized membrane protein YdjX (TVP38/TMEM64 family)